MTIRNPFFKFRLSGFSAFSGKTYLLLLLFAILLPACKKENTKPANTSQITLSSETLGSLPYYSLGYSFEKQKFLERLNSSSDIDIYLNEIVQPSGVPVGVQFSTNSVSESYGFYLNAGFDNLNDAEDYYRNYIKAYYPSFTTLTDTVKTYQVYTFQTWKLNYVKFLVRDIRAISKNDIADYFEVDIEYFIQRDGSDNLSE